MIDLWACVAAAMASAAIAIRANMLKPHHSVWAPAPWPVWVALIALSIVLAMNAISLGSGAAHATAREAVVYTVLAVASFVMLLNLQVHGRMSGEVIRRFGPAGLVSTFETRDPGRFMRQKGDRL